jgi:hypothetical protein
MSIGLGEEDGTMAIEDSALGIEVSRQQPPKEVARESGGGHRVGMGAGIDDWAKSPSP